MKFETIISGQARHRHSWMGFQDLTTTPWMRIPFQVLDEYWRIKKSKLKICFRRLRHPLPPHLSAPKWLWKGNQAAPKSRLIDIVLVFKNSASGDAIHNKKDAGQRWRGNRDQRLEVCCHGDWQVKERPFLLDPSSLPFRFCLIGLTFYTFMTTVVLLTSAPHMHVPWGQYLKLSLNVLYQYIMLSIASEICSWLPFILSTHSNIIL